MKNLFKKLIVPVICVFLAGAFSKPAEASAKNPDDVAKLQKFVNEQIEKGASLSANIEESTLDEQYKWDKNGNLKEINWYKCNFTGDIKLPSFSKLKYVVIRLSTGLKSIDAGRNLSLLQLNCRGCDDVKFYLPAALDKLSVKGCRNLEVLDASWNNIKSIDLSGNKKLYFLDIFGNKKLKGIDIKCCPAIENLYLAGMNLTEIDV